jgi:hypothetical protein
MTLAWRSVGSVGINSLHTVENDTGPDDANHAPFGLMIFHDPKAPKGGQVIMEPKRPTLRHSHLPCCTAILDK